MILVAHRTPATRAECERVARAGAKIFEADVQLDAAGSVVVSHFLPFGAAGRLQRDNWRVRWHTRAVRDPRLADLTAIVPEDCRVLLDLKERRAERRADLIRALVDTLPDRSRFVVCGHPVEDINALRGAGFRTWRTAGSSRQLAALLADGPLPDEAATVRHSLLRRDVVDRLHERVGAVVAWTVNSPARAGQLRAMGVDGVTTDRCAVMQLLAHGSN